MAAHAILSPSAASRWLACTPSARLEQQFPSRSSDAADEGTLAHALGELEIKMSRGIIIGAYYKAEKDKLKASKYYSKEMEGHVGNYAAFVIEQYNAALVTTKDAKLFVETKVDLTEFIPEGFGTADIIILADGTLHLIDLKYGKGVAVSVVNNKQLMSYALGVLRKFELFYDIKEIRLTIYQPRIDNISDWIVPVKELEEWGETVLIPGAKLAFAGEGEYKPGEHCRFCKAAAVCKANAAFNMEIAKHEFANPDLLTDAEVADVLSRITLFTAWVKTVTEYTLKTALQGKKWPGFKVVEGRANRVYGDTAKVEEVLIDAGFPRETIYAPQELLGITAMTGAIGTAAFNAHVKSLLVQPKGKPALVPVTDKRPEYSGLSSALADFATPLETE